MNKIRKRNLLQMLKRLFPEYKYFQVKNNGIIKFKKRRFSFWKNISFHELLLNDIIRKLSSYNGKSNEIKYDYITHLSNTIYSLQITKSRNIIDYIFSEFQKVVGMSEVDRKLRTFDSENTLTLRALMFTTPSLPLSLRNSFSNIKSLLRQQNKIDDRFTRVKICHII